MIHKWLQDRVEAIRGDDEWRENYMMIESKVENFPPELTSE